MASHSPSSLRSTGMSRVPDCPIWTGAGHRVRGSVAVRSEDKPLDVARRGSEQGEAAGRWSENDPKRGREDVRTAPPALGRPVPMNRSRAAIRPPATSILRGPRRAVKGPKFADRELIASSQLLPAHSDGAVRQCDHRWCTPNSRTLRRTSMPADVPLTDRNQCCAKSGSQRGSSWERRATHRGKSPLRRRDRPRGRP
jgi:hypothetical protein